MAAASSSPGAPRTGIAVIDSPLASFAILVWSRFDGNLELTLESIGPERARDEARRLGMPHAMAMAQGRSAA
jgi:hypothetical protein